LFLLPSALCLLPSSNFFTTSKAIIKKNLVSPYVMPCNEVIAFRPSVGAMYFLIVHHHYPRLRYKVGMVMGDCGYEFVTVVVFVIVEGYFDWGQFFGGYCLGDRLFVNLLKLGELVGDDCVYPGVSCSFVKSGCCAKVSGNSFEAGESVTGKGLLCVGWMRHNEDSLNIKAKGDRFQSFAGCGRALFVFGVITMV
jgi:hypothetical protein